MPRIEGTDLDVFPLCLGGNVFGWTADERDSVAVLDRYIEVGGNFIDTADMYAGGESEAIIGRWMLARANRDWLVSRRRWGWPRALRVCRRRRSAQPSRPSLAACRRSASTSTTPTATTRTRPSRRRSRRSTPRAGGEGPHVAASNYSAPRLAEALATSRRAKASPASSPSNPTTTSSSATGTRASSPTSSPGSTSRAFRISRWPAASSPASTDPGPAGRERAGGGASAYLDARGVALLEVLDAVAAAHGTTVAAVALAWLLAQPTVTAPIASARTPAQLTGLLKMTELELSLAEVAALSAVSAR